MAPGIGLSVVIPCFDEEERLPAALETATGYLEPKGIDYELVLVDDGSSDRTLDIMRDAAAGNPRVRIVAHRPNRGKGRALAEGVAVSTGELVLISDADFSTPIGELPKLEAALDEGAEIAIASRAKRGKEIVISQPIYRVLMGKCFNLAVQAILLPGLWDTQCGFKLFRGKIARELFAKLETDGFGFDVAILFLARRSGYRIREIPVRWSNSSPTKVAPFRDSAEMFIDLFRIRLGR